MTTQAQRAKHLQWLHEITALPTAAGHEDRVIAYIKNWMKTRKNLKLRSDKAGNLIIEHAKRSSAVKRAKPIYITAHLDHPAFVVKRRLDAKTIELEFRGGVDDPYFENAKIEIFDDEDRVHKATITKLDGKAKPFKLIEAKLSGAGASIKPGDVGRWAFTGKGKTPMVDRQGIFHTPACDDLAAAASALGAMDVMRNRKGLEHVGLIFTRAEEIGFVGAIEVCERKSVPRSARLICLETSRSFSDSPIGGGPIVRVGDRISVFDPRLTNRISAIMTKHASKNPKFKWQRKLMAGGACEASCFSAYGYESTCLCLPLGNYHNRRDIDEVLAGQRPALVGPEYISVDDFHGLVEMLIVTCTKLDDDTSKGLMSVMKKYRKELGYVLK
ncbi:MAG: hypothetical protein O7G85_01050 [Planctomycetota bacterium]|nr:hypothetical protein [Planctomycetota bacterium]